MCGSSQRQLFKSGSYFICKCLLWCCVLVKLGSTNASMPCHYRSCHTPSLSVRSVCQCRFVFGVYKVCSTLNNPSASHVVGASHSARGTDTHAGSISQVAPAGATGSWRRITTAARWPPSSQQGGGGTAGSPAGTLPPPLLGTPGPPPQHAQPASAPASGCSAPGLATAPPPPTAAPAAAACRPQPAAGTGRGGRIAVRACRLGSWRVSQEHVTVFLATRQASRASPGASHAPRSSLPGSHRAPGASWQAMRAQRRRRRQ